MNQYIFKFYYELYFKEMGDQIFIFNYSNYNNSFNNYQLISLDYIKDNKF